MELKMRFALCLLVWVAVSVGVCRAQPPDPKPVPPVQKVVELQNQEPEEVAKDFFLLYWYRNDGILPSLLEKVEHEEANIEALKKVRGQIARAQGTMELHVTNVKVETLIQEANLNRRATVSVTGQLSNQLGMKVTWQETLKLRRIEAQRELGYRLIPNEPSLDLKNQPDGYLQRIIDYIAFPQKMLKLQSQRQSALQVEALGLAVKQLVSDYDDKYAFDAANIKEKLKPYMQDSIIWTAPDDKAGTMSYSFNARLFNVEDAAIKDSAKTIMFYLGQDEKFDFRYDGKTVVGFVDGHVEFLEPKQIEDLRWEP